VEEEFTAKHSEGIRGDRSWEKPKGKFSGRFLGRVRGNALVQSGRLGGRTGELKLKDKKTTPDATKDSRGLGGSRFCTGEAKSELKKKKDKEFGSLARNLVGEAKNSLGPNPPVND